MALIVGLVVAVLLVLAVIDFLAMGLVIGLALLVVYAAYVSAPWLFVFPVLWLAWLAVARARSAR